MFALDIITTYYRFGSLFRGGGGGARGGGGGMEAQINHRHPHGIAATRTPTNSGARIG